MKNRLPHNEAPAGVIALLNSGFVDERLNAFSSATGEGGLWALEQYGLTGNWVHAAFVIYCHLNLRKL